MELDFTVHHLYLCQEHLYLNRSYHRITNYSYFIHLAWKVVGLEEIRMGTEQPFKLPSTDRNQNAKTLLMNKSPWIQPRVLKGNKDKHILKKNTKYLSKITRVQNMMSSTTREMFLLKL